MGTANGGMVMRARGDATPIGAAYVTRRRVVDAPEKSSRRRSSGGVRGRSRDVSAGARPGSDLGKPRDVPARAAGPDHGDARPRGVGRAELPLAAAVGAATGPVASTPGPERRSGRRSLRGRRRRTTPNAVVSLAHARVGKVGRVHFAFVGSEEAGASPRAILHRA